MQAVVDYTRSLGCKDDEVRRLGTDSVSWAARGSAQCSPLWSAERPSNHGERSSGDKIAARDVCSYALRRGDVGIHLVNTDGRLWRRLCLSWLRPSRAR